MSTITQTSAWQALQAHQEQLRNVHMRDLFAQDPNRFDTFSTSACGLLLDYSKHRITAETHDLLVQLATGAGLEQWIQRMFRGEKINHTENRAVLHTALRAPAGTSLEVEGSDVMTEIHAVLDRIESFSEKIRSGEWLGYTGKPIEAVVNIGIGGSDLGPKTVVRALAAHQHPRMRAYFVSNLDATQLGEVLQETDPETTLFIVASKTFSTQETLTNALSARRWLVDHAGREDVVSKHFVAVSTHRQRVTEFGIDPVNMFEFWDWVGGRYSLWSAIGLSIAVNLGMPAFREVLHGARQMDEHFMHTPFERNLPVLMGLLGIWYSDFWGAASHVVLPYDYALEFFPFHLQQLEMESNGKRVTRGGELVPMGTCPVLWGEPGNNGQHAFYQLMHQGTQLIPADFIVAMESQHDLPGHQEAVLSNALAQTRALMQGRNEEETAAMLRAAGMDEATLQANLPHRVFPGNQPSTTILYRKLTPTLVGSLIALYEHKAFTQSVIWDINAFDQWGVELGKQMASELLPEFSKTEPATAYDASTNGLLNTIKGRHG